MHKPSFRQKETRALAFWRAVDAEISTTSAPRVALREISILFYCGYSVTQAVKALAPSYRVTTQIGT